MPPWGARAFWGSNSWLAPPWPFRIPARHVSHARVSGVFLGCYVAGNECGRGYFEMSRPIVLVAWLRAGRVRLGAASGAGRARKSDGLILHDRVLEPDEMDRLSRQLPIVTLAGYATPTTANVHGDNRAGMQALARHLIRDHGYPTLAYLGGYADSPDSIERREVLAAEAAAAGATLDSGPGWQGYYFASGGAKVINRLLAAGRALPRAIVCANDQTALGVMSALREHGIVVLYTMLSRENLPARDSVLPTELMRRESCGCVDPDGPPSTRRYRL